MIEHRELPPARSAPTMVGLDGLIVGLRGMCERCDELFGPKDRRVVELAYDAVGLWAGQRIVHLRCVPPGVEILPSRPRPEPPKLPAVRPVCDGCGRTFATRDNLRRHLRRLNLCPGPGEAPQLSRRPPPRACDGCGRSFCDRHGLRRHQRLGRCLSRRELPA